MSKDTRYVFGFCTWHDTIDKVAVRNVLPRCPHCGSMLQECPTEEEWWASIAKFEVQFPGYEALIRWGQGKCFLDYNDLSRAYTEATGIVPPKFQ